MRGDARDNIYILDTLTASGKQIQDPGGKDSLVFKDLSLNLVNLHRENNDLLLDLNRDGAFDAANDLTISDFFAASGVGDRSLETIGNLKNYEIFDAFGSDAMAIAPDNI